MIKYLTLKSQYPNVTIMSYNSQRYYFVGIKCHECLIELKKLFLCIFTVSNDAVYWIICSFLA